MSKYKVGDKFRVVRGSRFNIGDVVTLSDDDGTDYPGFRRDSDGFQLYAFYSDLEPISGGLKSLFEAGKTYRTRDGREVKVYATDGTGTYPIHGAVDGQVMTWTCDGACYYGIEHDNDLMPPRAEPFVRKMWMNLYPNDESLFLHPSREVALAHNTTGVAIRAAVPVIVTEIVGDGQ